MSTYIVPFRFDHYEKKAGSLVIKILEPADIEKKKDALLRT